MEKKQVKRVGGLVAMVALLSGIVPGALAQPSGSQRVSQSSSGDQGNSNSLDPAISNDGRLVTFESDATNFAERDTNDSRDVFLYNRGDDSIDRISEATSGGQANGPSGNPVIAGNGRFVAFETDATNLSVKLDRNDEPDIYVHNVGTGQTNRISINNAGKQADGESYAPDISDDGRYVAFYSSAENLSVKKDDNYAWDVFVYDRKQRTTNRVSVTSKGKEGDGDSYEPAISGSGRYVAFSSDARNFDDNDRNSSTDVFVYDREKHETTRVSVASSGQQANGDSSSPAISSNGRYVAFVSDATNLVRDDSNAKTDVFVHDLRTGKTSVVSVSSDGEMGNGDVVVEDEHPVSISPNGALVAFVSNASNLVENDTNNAPDVFVRDRRASETSRVGRQAMNADIANGVVTFDSIASDEVMLDTNNAWDIFVATL